MTMKKLFSSPFRHEIDYIMELLASEHIPCLLRNQHLTNLFGQLPYEETVMSLWVEDDDYDAALKIIAPIDQAPQKVGLVCPKCGDTIVPPLKVCLSCTATTFSNKGSDEEADKESEEGSD